MTHVLPFMVFLRVGESSYIHYAVL